MLCRNSCGSQPDKKYSERFRQPFRFDSQPKFLFFPFGTLKNRLFLNPILHSLHSRKKAMSVSHLRATGRGHRHWKTSGSVPPSAKWRMTESLLAARPRRCPQRCNNCSGGWTSMDLSSYPAGKTRKAWGCIQWVHQGPTAANDPFQRVCVFFLRGRSKVSAFRWFALKSGHLPVPVQSCTLPGTKTWKCRISCLVLWSSKETCSTSNSLRKRRC